MCGRFCCSLTTESVTTRLYEDSLCKEKDVSWVDKDKYGPSYNVCPTRYVLCMRKDSTNKRVMQPMKWGFIPSWSRSESMAKPINARFETLQDRSIFDGAKMHSRCIVLAEGFYEWKSSNKKPFFVKRKDGQLMTFAGLYDTNKHLGDDLTTCVIITTHSSTFFASIHDRMPVILDRQDVNTWLDQGTTWCKTVTDLLKPFEGPLECYQVSDKVGQVKNDTADLIVPTDSKKSSITFFLKQEDPASKFAKSEPKRKFDKIEKPKKQKESSIIADDNITKRRKTEKNAVITSFFTKK